MTSQAIIDSNSLAGGTILFLLDIVIPATGTVSITSNNETISYNSTTYYPFPFTLNALETKKGEIAGCSLTVENINRVMQTYIMEYDRYLKNNGIEDNGITVTISLVNNSDKSLITSYEFDLQSFSSNAKNVTFNLGADNPFNRVYPPSKMFQNFCRFKFKSTQCGYSGSGETCNKTLTQCREYANSPRFGGFVGLGKGLRL